jgi:hypothetical protein
MNLGGRLGKIWHIKGMADPSVISSRLGSSASAIQTNSSRFSLFASGYRQPAQATEFQDGT